MALSCWQVSLTQKVQGVDISAWCPGTLAYVGLWGNPVNSRDSGEEDQQLPPQTAGSATQPLQCSTLWEAQQTTAPFQQPQREVQGFSQSTLSWGRGANRQKVESPGRPGGSRVSAETHGFGGHGGNRLNRVRSFSSTSLWEGTGQKQTPANPEGGACRYWGGTDQQDGGHAAARSMDKVGGCAGQEGIRVWDRASGTWPHQAHGPGCKWCLA